jgi:hypothetical protein
MIILRIAIVGAAVITAMAVQTASFAGDDIPYQSIKTGSIPILLPSEKDAIMALVHQARVSASSARDWDNRDLRGTASYVQHLVAEINHKTFAENSPKTREIDETVDQTVACFDGGFMQIQGEAKGKLVETGPRQADFQAETKGSVTSSRCIRKTESDSYDVDDANMVKRVIDGTVTLAASVRGIAVKRDAKREDPDDPPFKKGFDIEVTSSVSGELTTESIDLKSRQKSKHTVSTRNFSVWFRISDEKIKAYRELRWDPFGDEAIRAREIEYFQDLLKCRGEILLDVKVYPCSSIMNFVIEQGLGRRR